MYITPNTTIKLYKNIRLDTEYKNTIYFNNIEEQKNFFHGTISPIFMLEKHSYQRYTKNTMRVALSSDALYGCNYMAFQNTSYGNKWFYAFISDVEYINNETSEITFELDDMQTYFFDVTLLRSFVEREHSETDVAGDNIVAENVDLGDIVCRSMSRSGLFGSYAAVICHSGIDSSKKTGGTVAGLFSGCNYVGALISDDEDVEKLKLLLESIVESNQQDSVVSIFLMPLDFYTTEKEPREHKIKILKPKEVSEYEPRNQKLLTYPYNYLSVECGNNAAIYRYEWFDTEKCTFGMWGTVSCNPQILLAPEYYNGTSNISDSTFNYVEKLVMEGFPQVAWSVDSFRAWLAQEASGVALQGIASVTTAGMGMATGNAPLSISGIMAFGSVANSVILAGNRPNQTKGSNTGTIDVATKTKDFYFKFMQLSRQYAEIIDNYFDLEGYATKRVKIPNRNVRPHWTYTKTNGCNVIGNAPAPSIKKICQIYDKGITFWKNHNNIGNYSLDNRV